MSICPHCGGNGYHTWAGSGQCPGIQEQAVQIEEANAAIARLQDELLRVQIKRILAPAELERRLGHLEQALQRQDNAIIELKALLVRAADALENILPALSAIMKITIVPLIAELREAAGK